MKCAKDMVSVSDSLIYTCEFDGILKVKRNQLLSKYILKGTDKAIRHIPKESSILSVGYPIEKGGDLQIACTGTVACCELPEEAAHREMQEEMGITLKKGEIMPKPMHTEYELVKRGLRTIYHIMLAACKCRPVTKKESLKEQPKLIDKLDKVVIYVYGTTEDLQNLLLNTKFKIQGGELTYVGIIPLRKVMVWKSYIYRLPFRERYDMKCFSEADIRNQICPFWKSTKRCANRLRCSYLHNEYDCL